MSEITHSRVRLSGKPTIYSEGSAENLLVAPVQVDDFPPDQGELTFSAIQGYLSGHRRPGGVRRHVEPEGIDEIYFPIEGIVRVTRGEENTALVGRHSLDDRNSAWRLEFPKGEAPRLRQEGNARLIPGFVIPSGAEHGSSSYQGRSRFLAIKVDRSKTESQ